MSTHSANNFISNKLEERLNDGSIRKLRVEEGLVDFCSNDYLGYARLPFTHEKQEAHGSTGSRLLNGNSAYIESLEKQISLFHDAEAALIFNSGYDANLGLFSCLPQRGDTIIYDSLIHASIRDGMRLSYAWCYSFDHNDLDDLKRKLRQAKGRVYVAVESVYSMDGDFAPLKEIQQLCSDYQANLIVDEAHASGLFGKKGEGRVVELGLQHLVFARIHTFGKALGCHGAAVLSTNLLRDYLINFSRPFIYTTALPMQSLVSIKKAYDTLAEDDKGREKIRELIAFFKQKALLNSDATLQLIPSDSAIQCLVLPGNEFVKSVSFQLREQGFDVRPILSPTVAKGKERLRICLHTFNNFDQVESLLENLNGILTKINLFEK